MSEHNPLAASRQRLNELLGRHQYGSAIKLLEEIVNRRDAQSASLAAWGRERLIEVRELDQKMHQASAPLCATAETLLKRHEYSEAVKMLSSVPTQYRSPALRTMLQQATELRDECDHLQHDIEDAIRNDDTEALPALVKRLCRLMPNHKEIRKLAANLNKYGVTQFIARYKGQHDVLSHSDPVVEPKHLVLSICLVVGLFVGVSLMVRHYLATSSPPVTMKSPIAADQPNQAQSVVATVEPAGERKLPVASVPDTITSSLTGMKLKLIPAGVFQMGSPLSEPDREPCEGPQHTVRISQPFYMGVYEMTQGQFERITQTNPSFFSTKGDGRAQVTGQDTSQFPVEQISWFDAIDTCNKLSQQDGLAPYYTPTGAQRENASISSAKVAVLGGLGYRLPTEAEWEYACRGNSTTTFSFGDVLDGDQANINGNFPAGVNGTNLGRTRPVGQSAANSFGLHDLHGNVMEWCFDEYQQSVYDQRAEATVDPVINSGGETRVQRGGAWNLDYRFARSASRSRYVAQARIHYFGLRLVRNVDQPPER